MLTAPYVHFHPHGQNDNRNSNQNLTMIDYTNLYIKNLDPEVTSYDLFKNFRVFGKIISARVMKDTVTGKSKGYGFVSFTHMEEANDALQQMNGQLVNTKNIVVTFHEHKKQVKQQSNIPTTTTTPTTASYPATPPPTYPSIMNKSILKSMLSIPPSASNNAPHNPWQQQQNQTSWIQQQQEAKNIVSPMNSATMINNNPTNQQQTNNNNNIQYQKLREAIYLQLTEYQQKDLNDLVDLIGSLKKRDLSLCLFNPTFLKQKIDEAYEALYLFQHNTPSLMHQDAICSTASTSSISTTYQQQANAILSSLEGMSLNKKKRVFGDIFFPHVRETGIRHAPKVTIRLLDTVPLEELAFNMYDKKELTRKAQYAYNELYPSSSSTSTSK